MYTLKFSHLDLLRLISLVAGLTCGISCGSNIDGSGENSDAALAVDDDASAVNDDASAVNDDASAVNDDASAVNDDASAVVDAAPLSIDAVLPLADAALSSCSVSATPSSGTTETDFTVAWSSVGATSCTWEYNGVSQGAVACSGSVTTTLPLGTTLVRLLTVGPSGNHSCTSNTVTVTVPAASCVAVITPGSGSVGTTFTLAIAASNATTCSWALDGVNVGAIACDGTFSGQLAAGTHSVVVGMVGPGGNGSCTSNTVTVN